MNNKYTLTLTKNQIVLIKDALEEYFRIRMNQWIDLSNDLAAKNIDLSPENPKHSWLFDKYINDRDAIYEVFECIGRIIKLNGSKKTEKQLVAEDIWQVIRHELWKEQEIKNDWCVDAREPMRVSKEPLPVMKKIKKNLEKQYNEDN